MATNNSQHSFPMDITKFECGNYCPTDFSNTTENTLVTFSNMENTVIYVTKSERSLLTQ